MPLNEQKPTNRQPQQPDKKGVTALLDSKAIEKALVNLQRGANDAAVVELRKKESGTLPLRVVLNALGQAVYRIGLQTEYFFVRALRIFRRVVQEIYSIATAVALALATPFIHFFRLMLRDLLSPWQRVSTHFQQLKQQGTKGALLKASAHAGRSALFTLLGWLLPAGAALVFMFTAQQMLSDGFSLRVTYGGEPMGFVAADTVWDKAVQIVSSRIIATDGDEAGTEDEWLGTPEFSVVPIDSAARSSAEDLADIIIRKSSDHIQNAVGVTVNGQLIGVSNDGSALQAALDAVIEPHRALPHLSVGFAQNIQLAPGVYFTSSIHSTEEVMQQLAATPEYLQIKTVDREEFEEDVPIEVVEQPSDKYYEGVRRTVQRGKAGRQHVVAEITRIDGTEVARTPIEVTPIQEMKPKIVVVGTRKRSSSIGQVGGGRWTFPVPAMTSMGTYPGHRGYDFRAPYGSPIYAAEGGTVLNAEWHYSWGNYVLIDHHNGLYSLYAHCSSLAVSRGQEVQRGEVIGYIGATGNASGYHLHMEVWTDPSGSRWCLQNPLNYVSPP